MFKLGDGWSWSEICFDAETDGFIEKRYHAEYLDTGTVYDGTKPISDAELWERLVKAADEDGMETFLQIRGSAPECQAETGMTVQEFKERLALLKAETPHRAYTCVPVASNHILYDHNHAILGMILRGDHCWFYVDAQKYGFHTREAALAFALERLTAYHERCLKNAANKTKEPHYEPLRNPKKRLFLR